MTKKLNPDKDVTLSELAATISELVATNPDQPYDKMEPLPESPTDKAVAALKARYEAIIVEQEATIADIMAKLRQAEMKLVSQQEYIQRNRVGFRGGTI